MNNIKKTILLLFVAVFGFTVAANAQETTASFKQFNSKKEISADYVRYQSAYSQGQAGTVFNASINSVDYYFSSGVLAYRSYYKDMGNGIHFNYANADYYYDSSNKLSSYKIYHNYYDAGKCVSGRKAFNCTYRPTGEADKPAVQKVEEYLVSNGYKTISHYPKTGNANNTSSHFNAIDIYVLSNGKWIRTQRLEGVRASNNKIKSAKEIFYYANGKAKQIRVVSKPYYATEYLNFVKYQTSTIYNYNSKGKLIRKRIEHLYTKGTYRSYDETKTYYSNGRLKIRTITKRNYKTNKLTGAKRLAYRSNGTKYWYKVRTYKAGVIKKHYYTLYNKKGTVKAGGAYRVTVNFSKKGKATSAYKAKYKANGKLKKAYKIKLKKSLYKW